MIGIINIASYICDSKISNKGREFNGEVVSDTFIDNKIGIVTVARKEQNEKASDLCVKAFNNLLNKCSDLDTSAIDCICVCTQNGDYNLPHTSAIVHGKLGFSKNCAVFDISLGCSGYVYAINIMKNFMEANNFKNGLLFTSDPYSEIINNDDKNTSLIFGDGASVTWLSTEHIYNIGSIYTYSDGSQYNMLINEPDKPLFMDGRMIFNFALENVPNIINNNLQSSGLGYVDIDLFILHQASKYIVDSLTRIMKIDKLKVPFKIGEYGNTVSSSIPIILEEVLHTGNNKILLCGFGVGLSIASLILYKEQ